MTPHRISSHPIEGRKILIETNPEGRRISWCPNYGVLIKPCVTTLEVKEGYSDLLRIDDKHISSIPSPA